MIFYNKLKKISPINRICILVAIFDVMIEFTVAEISKLYIYKKQAPIAIELKCIHENLKKNVLATYIYKCYQIYRIVLLLKWAQEKHIKFIYKLKLIENRPPFW